MKCLIAMALAVASAAAAAQHDGLRRDWFLVLSEAQALSAQLLECPNHAFGRLEDGARGITQRKAGLPPEALCFVQFCITDQVESIARCAPLTDLAAVNPFVTLSDAGPAPDTAVWPGCNQPMLNRLRELVAAAGSVPLLARIGIGGVESRYITQREPTFEEIEWMIVAAVGAGFRGIVWVGQFDTGGRLRALGDGLERSAGDLGRARPVRWAVAPAGLPVSALATDTRLAVALLHPGYFRDPRTGRLQSLPVDPPLQEGVLNLRPPVGVTVKAGVSLHGPPVVPQSGTQGDFLVPYRFAGGGTLLFLGLATMGDDGAGAGARAP